jgi:uncharacterized repeat protein (TIGR01451 family)
MGNVGGSNFEDGRRRGRRALSRSGIVRLALLGVVALALVTLTSSATAVNACTSANSGCLFELDGNVFVDHAGAGTPDDWSRIFDPATYGASGAFATDFIGGDKEAPANDASFFTGSNKDIDQLNTWQWSATGNNQAKDELTDAYGAAYADPNTNGDTIVYFGADRYATNGDSQVGFWFMQTPLCLNPDHSFTCPSSNPPVHQDGDLLVLSNFGNGGSQPTIAVYEWQNGALNQTPIATGTTCTTTQVDECAMVNTGANGIPVPWPYTGKFSGSGTVAQNGFFEGGIDLNKVFGNTTPPCFTTFLAETRSSQSVTATLEDLALGTLNSCGSIELKKHWVGPPGNTTIKIGKTAGAADVGTANANGADADTAAQQVAAATYHVSETTPRNSSTTTPLGGYTTSLSCVNNKNANNPVTVTTTPEDGPPLPAGSQGDSVPVAAGDVVVCTYTNTYIKTTPSAATTLHKASDNSVIPVSPVQHLPLGTSVYDTATITATDNQPLSGTLTYEFFSGSTTCTGTPAHTDTGLALNTQSTATGALGAGSYSFHAKFVASNDPAHNDSAFSTCEPFIVDQAQPGISTIVKDSQGNTIDNATHPASLGVVAHDTATLSGQVGSLGFAGTPGTVTYKLYNTINCTGTAASSQDVTVTDPATVPNSNDTAPLATGDYSYQATYNGNANYTSATGACEPFHVNKTQPGISTIVKDSQGNTIDNATHPASLGVVAHDTATLSGQVGSFGFAGTPGTVTYKLYNTINCTGTAASSQDVTVTNPATVPNSADTSPLATGDYSYQATYNGNANYLSATGACEPFHVNKAQPGISTIVKDSQGNTVDNGAHPAALGTVVHDTATLSGQVGSLGFAGTPGTVTYKLYNTINCTGTAATSQDVTVTNPATVPNSADSSALAAGDYSYQATYNGNANYLSATGACEPFHVNQAQPGISTIVKDSLGNTVDNGANKAALGTVVHDTATLNSQVGSFGFAGAPGTVTYKLYTTINCTGTAASSQDVTVTNPATVPNSADTSPLATGDYSYQATYNGNANYLPATGACEPFHVNQATPTISTIVKDTQGNTVDNTTHKAALGTVVHDTATLGAQVGSFGFAGTPGTVTYKLYTTINCTGTAASSQDVTVTNPATVPNSADTSPLATGDYSYQATYNGNANYASATGACEPFHVNQAQPGIATIVKDNQGHTVDLQHPTEIGIPVHDTATLSGSVGSFPFGNGTLVGPNAATVTYEFFTTVDCSGTPTFETVTVGADGSVPGASPKANLGAGSYSYQAIYNGNANYAPATGTCEPFKVNKATPTAVTALHNAATNAKVDNNTALPLGSGLYDVATITSPDAFALTGTVTFQFFTNGNCTGPASPDNVQTGVALSDGTHAQSSSHLNLPAGSYSFDAQYIAGSDSNHGDSAVSDCEPFTINQATPSISTIVKDSQGHTVDNGANKAALGTVVHDTATLSGQVDSLGLAGTPGTVTYKLYNTIDCTGTAASSQDVTVTNPATVPNSADTSPLATGDYSYQATYNGNANYAAATGACEPFHVNKAQPSIATTVKDTTGKTVDAQNTAPLGTVVHDTSLLSGAVTGFAFGNGTLAGAGAATVTYQFFTSLNCTGQPTTQTVTVAANGTVPDAAATAPLGAGNYSYQAIYNGNANYLPATGACEPFVINKGTPATGTTLHNASGGGVIANGTALDNGSGVFDTAQVTTSDSFALTGTVTFQFFANGTCNGTATSTQTSVAIINGNATSSTQSNLAPGSYSFNAQYVAGTDSNHVSSAVSSCEPFSVNSPPPPPSTPQNPSIAITKNPKSQSILTGQTATFTIVVTNTGNVTLTNVTVTDQLSPDCNKTSAQIGALASMAPGASVTYNCSLSNVQASFTNVAVATGTPPSGSNVTAQDSAPVTVNAPFVPPKPAPTPTHPAIDIVKDPKAQTIGEGDKATFKITVTNTGDVTLTDVTVTDPLSPDCDRNLGTLNVGQSKSYTCTKSNVKADFENVATATGKPPTGAKVSAKDNANIAVKPFIPPQHPRIAISKDPNNQTVTTSLSTTTTATGANKTTVTYGNAHFTIKVTNTGDVALHAVVVNDPLSPACNKSLGTIAAGKSKTYTCSKSTVTSNFTNVANATGTSPKGVKVHASDTANVKVTTKTESTSGAKFTG